MERLNLLENLKQLLGQKVKVYIDRPIGSTHPKYSDMIYNVNYGYIKEYVAIDNEFQDAYVLGIDEPIKEIEGTVIAIINRINDLEDKLIVSVNNITYTNEEIIKKINFQEKYYNYEIIK